MLTQTKMSYCAPSAAHHNDMRTNKYSICGLCDDGCCCGGCIFHCIQILCAFANWLSVHFILTLTFLLSQANDSQINNGYVNKCCVNEMECIRNVHRNEWVQGNNLCNFFVQKSQMVVVFGNKANNYLLLSEERKKKKKTLIVILFLECVLVRLCVCEEIYQVESKEICE